MNQLTAIVTINTFDDRPDAQGRLLAELERALRYRFTDITVAPADPETA